MNYSVRYMLLFLYVKYNDQIHDTLPIYKLQCSDICYSSYIITKVVRYMLLFLYINYSGQIHVALPIYELQWSDTCCSS